MENIDLSLYPDNPVICTIGEKVYFDSLAGSLKGIVLDVKSNIGYRISGQSSAYTLTVKITSKNNPCWHYGEIIESNSLHIIPRRFYHKTGIFTFTVYPDYVWMKGDN